jgi:hypothetical protein
MRRFRNDRIAVAVRAIQVGSIEFVPPTKRSTGIFLPADDLFLKVDLGAVPMLQRHADTARHVDTDCNRDPFAFVRAPYGRVAILSTGSETPRQQAFLRWSDRQHFS